MPETVACNICGSPNSVPQPDKTRFLNIPEPLMVSRCNECKLVFLSPRGTIEEIRDLYHSHPYYAKSNANRGENRRQFYDLRFARLEKWMPDRGRMLSIGCLEGGYALVVAEARGWNVVGVEFSEILAGYAREQLGVRVEVAEAWDLSGLADNTFDAIYTHSFEHFLDPRRTLQECRRLLAPDGFIMFEVPNQFYSLKDKLKMAVLKGSPAKVKNLFYAKAAAELHTYFFDPHTVRRLMESEGFEILDFRTYLPRHPVYLCNPTGRWLQESIYAIGGLFGRGPSMEIVLRPK